MPALLLSFTRIVAGHAHCAACLDACHLACPAPALCSSCIPVHASMCATQLAESHIHMPQLFSRTVRSAAVVHCHALSHSFMRAPSSMMSAHLCRFDTVIAIGVSLNIILQKHFMLSITRIHSFINTGFFLVVSLGLLCSSLGDTMFELQRVSTHC